jgi:hypothetical protein
MTVISRIKSHSLLRFVGFSPSFNQLTSCLRRTLLTGLLVGLIWLPGLLINPALAMPNAAVTVPGETAPRLVDSSTEGDRLSALISCLPSQLSQPDLKRALSEMGNDQLERAFNLKTKPQLSQAEIALESCLNH